jgi:hypothetical protein
MPGARCARGRACSVESTRVSHHGHAGSPGIPRAMVYGLFRALPGDRAFLPPSPAKIAFHQLDASVGASGPHDFAVRKRPPSSSAPPASTASRPASVTIASRPSVQGCPGKVFWLQIQGWRTRVDCISGTWPPICSPFAPLAEHWGKAKTWVAPTVDCKTSLKDSPALRGNFPRTALLCGTGR